MTTATAETVWNDESIKRFIRDTLHARNENVRKRVASGRELWSYTKDYYWNRLIAPERDLFDAAIYDLVRELQAPDLLLKEWSVAYPDTSELRKEFRFSKFAPAQALIELASQTVHENARYAQRLCDILQSACVPHFKRDPDGLELLESTAVFFLRCNFPVTAQFWVNLFDSQSVALPGRLQLVLRGLYLNGTERLSETLLELEKHLVDVPNDKQVLERELRIFMEIITRAKIHEPLTHHLEKIHVIRGKSRIEKQLLQLLSLSKWVPSGSSGAAAVAAIAFPPLLNKKGGLEDYDKVVRVATGVQH